MTFAQPAQAMTFAQPSTAVTFTQPFQASTFSGTQPLIVYAGAPGVASTQTAPADTQAGGDKMTQAQAIQKLTDSIEKLTKVANKHMEILQNHESRILILETKKMQPGQ